MVDQKITDLTDIGAAIVGTDIFEMTDDPGGSPLSRKSTFTRLSTFMKTVVAQEGSLNITIDGNGSAITTGSHLIGQVPYSCTINAAEVTADVSGSIVVDIWVDSYANYPPVDADSITASAPPTLSSAIKSTDATLTGWTTTLTEGDWIWANVDSATTVTKAVVALDVTRT